MAEFYVEVSARENGDHVVHDASCPQLPAKETLQYLGAISNCGSALKKASERLIKVNGCPLCTSSCHAAA